MAGKAKKKEILCIANFDEDGDTYFYAGSWYKCSACDPEDGSLSVVNEFNGVSHFDADNAEDYFDTAAAEKAAAIDEAINQGHGSYMNDADIIEELLQKYTREELELLGFGNFIRDYFHAKDPATEAPPQ